MCNNNVKENKNFTDTPVSEPSFQSPLINSQSMAKKWFDIWGILKMTSVKSVEPENNCFSVNHNIRRRSKLLLSRFLKFVLVLIL